MSEYNKVDIVKTRELVEKIKEGSTSSRTPLSELLRQCLRLGKLLGNNLLLSWASSELNGYQSDGELPDYRVLPAQVFGHFSGPFGSGIRNAAIPKYAIEEAHQKNLFTNFLYDPIAELEQLATGDKKDPLQSYWQADVIAYYQRKQIYEGMVLAAAWRNLTKPALDGVLDTIRTRVLEFILAIEDELNMNDQSNGRELDIKPPISDKVTQNVHNIIYGGNVSVGNFGQTIQNITNIHPGDLSGLKKYLKELGLTDLLIHDLEQALAKDENSQTQPGSATSSWLSRVMIMIGRGTLSLASNTAGSLIASALMQYLGIKI